MKRKLSALEGKTEALHSDTSEVIEIYDRKEFKHLSAGFCSICSESSWDGSSLPYHELAGPGLERLCYLMLLEQGGIPRYFGKPGQKQYGIDLLVSHGGECTVYQCKNVKSFPLSEMKKALELFEKEWLGRPELPTPKQFVLCCSLPLQERKQNEKWTALERQFHERTGVSVVFWDCNYLDERLKRLPDVVAELFSDRVAERFCNMNDWNKDLFRPVVAGSGEITIDRYLNLKAAGRIYLAPQLAEDFVRKLENNGSLLIRGLPGTGKTTTGLALAESFHQGKHRIFYVNLRYDISEDALVTGIKRRLTRPTIFLLDDCHGKFDEMLDNMQNRVLSFAEMRGRGLLVFTARTTPTPEGMPRGDYSNFEESLNQNEAILELQPTPDVFRQIITLVKPHFAGLSEERLHKVFEFTGQDLFLLDQLLETISSPDDIDQLEPETLFEETLVRYFGAPTVDHPGFMNLAALAQFDLMPPVSSFRDFDLEKENEKAVKELLVTADRPARYFFLHSSAAELVFRSLAWNDGINDYPELAADYLIEFFKSRRKSDKKLAVDLSNAIWNRLKLTSDENEENRLRGRFLADDGIYALIEDTFEQLPLNLLAVCLIILRSTDAATYERYLDLAQRKIADGTVLEMAITRPLWEIGFFLQLVKRYYPPLLSSLQSQLVDRGLRSLIKLTKFQNILLLLAKLAEPDNPQWAALLDLIQDSELEEIIQRTIASGRSIGTIDLALQELKKTNPDLLDKLERKIGAKRYLYLITSAGTIFELFRAIQHSSLLMAGELIEALDAETLDTLIAKTIASGHSIGTIHFTLRELKNTNPDLLDKLERKIGAKRYLDLITSAGTIFELFMIIRDSSLSMAEELIEVLDVEILDTLIAKTIASGRSIGTIDLTLRELKETNPDLLEQLERKIGAKRYLHLITSAGTIFELFMVIKDSSLSMAGALIEALDAEALDTLIAKTIASGRSIGTINLTLWELKKANPDLLEQLERKIGAKRWWQLICANGTMRILTQISQRMDESFKWELEQDSQALSLDDWQKLLLRGDFADLAHFVKWAASYFPELSTPTFLRRFKPTFETLIGRDGWEVLDQGQALLIKAPSFPIKPYLLSLVRDYLAPVEQGSLCFSSFDEAIHCIHLLWHVCQSRRQELTNSLLTILPEEEVWYVDEKFLRSARLLFFILANPQAPPDDARRVLAMGNSGEVASLCVEATTLDIFLYLWNLYSLWFEWEKAEENTFATFLNSEIRNIISDVLTTRFQTHADEAETDNLIALVGLLSFITGLDFSPAEKARWLSKLPSFDELLSRAEAKTFIPGFFFLFGLEYIFDRADSVPQQTWLGLLLKAEEYPEKFAASEYLHNLVCVRAGK